MTREDTIRIMAILRGAYPAFYRNMGEQEALEVVNLWAVMFADDDMRLVTAAVQALIATDTKGYPPHIGAVKEQMRKLTAPDDMSEAEAWSLIRKAISNGLYGANEEFARLPPVCQKIVGAPAQLREWALCDTDVVQTVIASNVQRAYRTVQQRETEQAKLPKEVKRAISGIAQRYALKQSGGE